jgi:hypothetical protein
MEVIIKTMKLFITILMLSGCCNWSDTCEKDESKPIEVNQVIKLDSTKR